VPEYRSDEYDDSLDEALEGTPGNITIQQMRAAIDREKAKRKEAEARAKEADGLREQLAEIEAQKRIEAAKAVLAKLGLPLGLAQDVPSADEEAIKAWAVSRGLLAPVAQEASAPAFVPFTSQEGVPVDSKMPYNQFLQLMASEATRAMAEKAFAEGRVEGF
jgi:crotonobetainyl-CoA:carnitine CoA-transferase CaiB-like acyl-CoA transferase